MPPASSSTPSHPRVRRLLTGLLTFAIALGGVVLVLVLFEGRDHSQLRNDAAPVAGPGRLLADQGHAHLQAGQRPDKPYESDPPASGAHVPATIGADATALSDDQILSALEVGDVVLLYGGARPPAPLRAVQRRVAGPFDPSLAKVGQAVVLGRRAGTQGVVALAWRRVLRVGDAGDPALEQFASFWLGRGASGG